MLLHVGNLTPPVHPDEICNGVGNTDEWRGRESVPAPENVHVVVSRRDLIELGRILVQSSS